MQGFIYPAKPSKHCSIAITNSKQKKAQSVANMHACMGDCSTVYLANLSSYDMMSFIDWVDDARNKNNSNCRNCKSEHTLQTG
ncbi:hypothetical protein VN97_g3651 [Penicillium thymicola]|uniref:Uncharacterized protein n=1 Tax=Penicillium thymicola TaxID=293382 RepID=A0AAI9TLW3_PENTH|nr:hypothetical protein VN97_g3651 [Penicillium thymicola]